MISDGDGRIVEGQSATERLPPASTAVPSPLVFSAGTALAPGEYMLKLAAAEGNRVGSVEHPIHVSLIEGGALQLSDLTVGGPQAATAPLQPSVDYTVRFGAVHGYIEAYGAAAGTATVTYEVGRDEQSPALVSAVVAARPISESRALFSRILPVSALPPGRYRLRAIVDVGGAPVGALSRAFEIAGDAFPADAADARRTDVVLRSGTELFLPIDPGDLRIPFQGADALRAEVLDPFAARVPASVKASFDAGIGHLRNGEFASAESSFKLAIRPGLDFTAAVTYLAVAFAASGHDAEAANAWQTALVGGSNLPQIYVWLGDALLRIREFERARTTLEEALRRWPADVRFARPLAVLNATTGRGYEAILRLEQYLAANGSDPGALSLGVQWIYTVHLSGATIRDRAADVAAGANVRRGIQASQRPEAAARDRVARLPREIRAVGWPLLPFRLCLLLDASRHVAADGSMLPGAGVPIAVKEHAGGEGTDSWQAGIGHHDYRRIANPSHRHDNRQRRAVDAAAVHARVEPPQVVAHFLDAGDIVAVRTRCAVFPARDREGANQRHVLHALGELAFQLRQRRRVDD